MRRATRCCVGSAVAWAVAWAVSWCAADIGPVTLRDGRLIAADQVEAVSDEGVMLRPGLADDGRPSARLVPWIEVEGVGAAGASSWGEAEAYRELADTLRRAELRLFRGDVPGTLRLLGPVAEQYLVESGGTREASNGPTTGLVASSLVICRTLRNDRAGAAHAWLAWRGTREGPTRAWIDAETGLVPALPPVWTRDDAAAFLAGPAESPTGSEYAAELAGMYALAARHAAGADLSEHTGGPSTRLRADAGVRLAWEMVRAQVDPELAGRREARDALRRRLRSGSPAWEEAWACLGIGASLLGEADPMDADAGAAELVGVVIAHRDAAPGLAGLALSLVTDYFERTGRRDHAGAVAAMDRAARRGLAVGGVRPGERADEKDDGTVDAIDDSFGDAIEELP